LHSVPAGGIICLQRAVTLQGLPVPRDMPRSRRSANEGNTCRFSSPVWPARVLSLSSKNSLGKAQDALIAGRRFAYQLPSRQCGPFAYLVEVAGGLSSDGRRSILDIPIDRIDQRTQFIVGSKNEVRRIEEMVARG
jgi:hypothetical protein